MRAGAVTTETAPENIPVTGKKGCRRLPWYTVAVIVILTAVITFMSAFSILYVRHEYEKDKINAEYSEKLMYDVAVINQIKSIYEEVYVKEITDFDLDGYIYINMSGLSGFDRDSLTSVIANTYIAMTGDRYGEYYTPKQYLDLSAEMRGESVGIGVYVRADGVRGAIEVLAVFEDSPAKSAGIKVGDYLIAADGTNLEGLTTNEAAAIISGDAGTPVKLTVERDGENIDIEAVRQKYIAGTVFPSMASDGKTGVIRITQFTDATPGQFRKAVDGLFEKGATRLVFDMRDNPGGLLNSVISVLSYIFPKDTALIQDVDKAGNKNVLYSQDEHIIDCPMAVLTDKGTASAAELFTVNMRDYKVAFTVGTKTYGKGVEQSFVSLVNGGMLKITSKWYSSVLSDNYDGIGLEPDIAQKPAKGYESASPFTLPEENDSQLQRAIEEFNNRENN